MDLRGERCGNATPSHFNRSIIIIGPSFARVNTRSAAGPTQDQNTGSTFSAEEPGDSTSRDIIAETRPEGLSLVRDSQVTPPLSGNQDANDQLRDDKSLYEQTNTPGDSSDKDQVMTDAGEASYNVAMNVVEDEDQARMEEEIARLEKAERLANT